MYVCMYIYIYNIYIYIYIYIYTIDEITTITTHKILSITTI